MFTKLLRKLALKHINTVPDFAVGDQADPYMLRWYWIPRNRLFNIYIHEFLKDDDDRALHDHPWASLSLLVRGGMLEHHLSPNGCYPRKRYLQHGDWTYRPAQFAHRLVVPVQDLPPVTVFFTGPKIREWGFLCPKGWRHWTDYVSPDTPGAVGRGCGEMPTPTLDDLESSDIGRARINLITILFFMIVASVLLIWTPLIYWMFW